MSVKFKILVLASVLAVGGCEARQLYISHDTVIGLNASVNTERTSGKLLFGYDRQFGVLIPKSVDVGESKDGESREAMSVLSCSQVRVDGITLARFVEHLATGEAAKNFATALAENPSEVNLGFFDCFESPTGAEQNQGGNKDVVPNSGVADANIQSLE